MALKINKATNKQTNKPCGQPFPVFMLKIGKGWPQGLFTAIEMLSPNYHVF
jgi:hypothetical protein